MNKLQIFGMSCLVIFVFSLSPRFVSAQNANPKVMTKEVVVTPQDKATDGAMLLTGQNRSEYALPYSGMLPDHPLYFLKTLRDRIIEMLVVDPVRRGEFYLLQSDKWIGAAQILVGKGNKALAQTFLLSSSQRMRQAIDQLTTASGSGKTLPGGEIDRFTNAINKHLEIIDELTMLDGAATRDLLVQSLEELGKLK